MATRAHAVLALLAALVAAPPAGARADDRQPDAAVAVRRIVEQTNAFRAAHGAAPVAVDARLADAARRFADHMARTDRYGHEADGRHPAERAQASGYAHCRVAENIAYQFHSDGFAARELADLFVRGWRESPGHRANMLDREVDEIGVAIAQSRRSGRYYAVQMFGRPASRAVEFSLANATPGVVAYELDGETLRLPPRVTRTHRQCSAPRLTLRLPGQAQAATVRPANGDRYTVEPAGPQRLRLRQGPSGR